MSEHLRQTIRTLLAEELAAQGINVTPSSDPSIREEVVSIESDRELSNFVRRLLQMTKDNQLRADIEAGRYLFRLASDSRRTEISSAHGTAAAIGETVSLESGLITEKQINSLPDNVAVVKAGTKVKFTPLAMDALRAGGIKVERLKK